MTLYRSTTILSAKFMAETRIIGHTSPLPGCTIWCRNFKIIWNAHSPELSMSYHSSHDGSSVDGAPSLSPTTPRSVEVLSYKSRHIDQMSPGKQHAHLGYNTSRLPSPPHAQRYSRKSAAGVDPRLFACRHSCDDDEAESDSSVRGPHRTW
jgi:hypothetical protein